MSLGRPRRTPPINNHGVMTGTTCVDTFCQCFTRGAEGRLQYLAVPGAQVTRCFTINDHNDLGGEYLLPNGERHAFIARRQ
jgi:hypothetical protein